jgi:hypothetical protein
LILLFIYQLFESLHLFRGCECTQLPHPLLYILALLLLFVVSLVDPPSQLCEQGVNSGGATLLVDLCVLLCDLLIEEELVEGESQVELQLLRAHLDVVLEDLGRVEVVRVALALEGQVRESQRREGLLEVVDLKLQDIVHRVKPQLYRGLKSHSVDVGLLLVS